MRHIRDERQDRILSWLCEKSRGGSIRGMAELRIAKPILLRELKTLLKLGLVTQGGGRLFERVWSITGRGQEALGA